MSLRPLPEDLQEIAENELNEKPNEVHENIRIIKEWIAQEPHLNSRTDDQWILTYLRGCKFSLELTKRKIDYYYRMRSIAPQILSNRDVSSTQIQDVLDKKVVIPLEINKKGQQFFLVRLGAPGADHLSLMQMIKTGLMMYDILIEENDYLMLGQCIIVDCKGMNLSRLMEFTITQLKIALSLQYAFPIRIKKIIGLNVPWKAIATAEIIKAMLSKKLSSRVYICPENDLEELYKFVPLAFLPKEYGGEACLNKMSEYWKQKLNDYQEWFIKDAVYGTDEKKRIITTTDEEFYGMDGSFKQLELD